MDYQSALAFLDEHTNLEGSRDGRFTAPLPTAGQVGGLSLDSMIELMAALGDPHKAYRCLHLTGTNGKGSTARFIAAILGTMDLSVGLYTSPNLHKINERISWGGRDITDEEFAEVIATLAGVVPLLKNTPSRFELLTAAAFLWFAEVGAEVAVVEVGLLGRFDATNVIDADVAVITNIGKDHTDGADGWERAVAAEKAGIIGPDSHVVLGSVMGDLRTIVEAEPAKSLVEFGTDFSVGDNAVAVGGRLVDLSTPQADYEQIFVPFHGAHQASNLATAVMAVEAFFDRPTPQELIEEALGVAELPARFEVVATDPLIILDGAHNAHGAAAVRATLDDEFARLGSRVLVIGMLDGKSPKEVLEAFNAADFDAVICTQVQYSRSVPAADIAKAAASLGIDAEVVPSPVDAILRARAVTAEEDLILVSGSIYVVSEIRWALLS